MKSRYFRGPLVAACATLALTGCATLKDEFGAPDGAAGVYMTKAMVAETPAQRADRYLLALGILAPLALDTSVDTEDEIGAVAAVNTALTALAALYEAAPGCTAGATREGCISEARGEIGSYRFETLGYDVQKSLYYLAKTATINLDLGGAAEDLMALDFTAVSKLLFRAKTLVPHLRRAAAGYRDGNVIYAIAVDEACAGSTDAACKALHQKLTAYFGGGKPPVEGVEERRIIEMGRAARAALGALQTRPWHLSQDQRAAVLANVVAGCERVSSAGTLRSDEAGGLEVKNCTESDGKGKLEEAILSRGDR
ncbi:MAG: hypothetical protein AB7U46_10765 [Paenirhodobacter sp.]|uniref:hypothetical protein n=1 Tax=Paenirhodobacter sp. TaxID=1965326 RepID=UPI003D10ACB8